jgi:peptide/nickel transport system permease protein
MIGSVVFFVLPPGRLTNTTKARLYAGLGSVFILVLCTVFIVIADVSEITVNSDVATRVLEQRDASGTTITVYSGTVEATGEVITSNTPIGDKLKVKINLLEYLLNQISFERLMVVVFVGLAIFLLYIIATGSRAIRNYLITRLLLMIPTIWMLVTIVFIAMRVLPGDPIQGNLKPGIDPAQIETIRAQVGLNKPITEQYIDYITGVAQGDFGTTLSVNGRGSSVNDLIATRIPATIELIFPAVLIMLLFGIYSGAWAAYRHRGLPDYSLRVSSVVLYAIPIFWLGLMLQLVFASELGILPVSNRYPSRIPFPTRTHMYSLDAFMAQDWSALGTVLRHMVLPTVTLSVALIGVFIRLTRSNMIEILQEDFVNAARARGVPENRVVYRHALRNSFIPIMTFIGLQIAVLLGGAILTETTFSWNGMGMLIRDGIRQRDFMVVQGAVTVFAISVGIISTLTDILYAFIDPRIRY